MEDVRSEVWKHLLKPHDAARQSSTSPLRRSSSWRRSGESGCYEGPVAQVNKPQRAARPLSCIDGGTVDKWLQTLERIQSRPLQRQIPQSVDRTVSTPALPNEMTGRCPPCPSSSSVQMRKPPSSLCGSTVGSLESLETVAGSERSSAVHIKSSPGTDRAKFCSLAPVRFGWLPIQRRVVLTDVSSNGGHHDNSRCQQKLKSPVTPVLLKFPDKLNPSGTNDSELGKTVRPESVGFRYRRTPEKTSPSLLQASRSINLEGGKNGSRGWNPAAGASSKVDTVQSSHIGPEFSKPALKDPPFRRGSMPESLPPSAASSGDSSCARRYSSSISSITITSRKVTRTSSLPDTSRLSPTSPPYVPSSHATPHRKALVVKVTEQRTQSKTTPGANVSDQPIIQNSACNQTQDHEGFHHPVVLRRRKPTIVKTIEKTEHVSREQWDTIKTAQYRHSYTEGLNAADEVNHNCNADDGLLASAADPSLLNHTLNVSVQPGGNQWRSSMVPHKSSVSLFLHKPTDRSSVEETDRRTERSPRRPLSCDASFFNHTGLEANTATGPAFHEKSSPVSQKAKVDLKSRSEREDSRNSACRSEAGNLRGGIPGRSEWDRTLGKREEHISGIKPLTLLKVPDDVPLPTAQALLALNAAAVIANIKLQRRQRQHHNTPATSQPAAADDGKKNVSGEAGGDGPNQTSLVGFGSEDVPPESPLAPMTLREALAIRRPDFIRRSQARVQALERRSRERQREALQNIHSSPQRPESGCMQHDRDSLVKSKDRHNNGKEAFVWSRRNYNQLPEVRKRREEERRRKEEERRKLASRTNRLRAELFKKKLLEQLLQRGNN